jgi:catalase
MSSGESAGGPDRVIDCLHRMETQLRNVPGYRRGHARGIGLHGTFTATPEVAALTTAEHLQGDPIACVVRLSNGGASPYLADRSGPKTGNPLGHAVRFELPSGDNSTWTALNLAAFPPHTPDDFIAMVTAQKPALPGGGANPLAMAAFALPRPHTLRGVKAAATLKPPKSFATARFNGFHSYWLVDAEGRRQAFRFRWMPVAGIQDFDPADDVAVPPQYVIDEIRGRVAAGPVAWRLLFQLAEPGDDIDDLTKVWPESRRLLDAGELVVDRLHADQQLVEELIFDPTRVPPGIACSDDPLLHFRSESYAESHRRRLSETKPAIRPG